MSFNTAVSALMIFINECQNAEEISQKIWEKFLVILAPFAPFIAEELWEKLGKKNSIHLESWPKYDEKIIQEEQTTLIIQINGKLRDKIEVSAGISEKEIKEKVLAREKVQRFLKDQSPKKMIVVKNRLINVVV